MRRGRHRKLGRVDPHQPAELQIRGGVGYVPITFEGLTDYCGYRVWTAAGGRGRRLDQSVHGADFWQAEYDAATHRWRQTYNLPLDTLADARGRVRVVLEPEPAR
jgi:hypothetical protein